MGVRDDVDAVEGKFRHFLAWHGDFVILTCAPTYTPHSAAVQQRYRLVTLASRVWI